MLIDRKTFLQHLAFLPVLWPRGAVLRSNALESHSDVFFVAGVDAPLWEAVRVRGEWR